jgi:predicted metal-dependent hydrolase
MPEVRYGDKVIKYEFVERVNLKAHYITVEKGVGVILKGKTIPETKQKELIIKKARWIINKLALVESIEKKDIVTGSRIQYLGRNYYTQVIIDDTIKKTRVHFTESKFTITINSGISDVQSEIQIALDHFFRIKAKEKLSPRIKKWCEQAGLKPNQIKFQKLEKRWGSCTPENNIILNYLAIKLPFTLIDYLIVHELCHIKEKNHSKAFYSLLSKYIANWKSLDEKMWGLKM